MWERWLPPLPTVLPACLSGALLSTAFPPLSVGAISYFALVPILASLFRGGFGAKASFKAGFLFGLTFFLCLLWWIVRLLPWANVTFPWLMTPALVLLILYLSLYPAFTFLLLSFISGGKWKIALAVGPPLWTLGEIVRSRSELGFPWGVLGYALSYYPPMIQIASCFGLFGLSFFIAVVNFLFASLFLVKSPGKRLAPLVLGICLVAANGWYGGLAMDRLLEKGDNDSLVVAVVQPNVDLSIKWDPAFTDSTFSLIERLARSASRIRPDLIVFPETSAPVYIWYERAYRVRLSEMARQLDIPVFIGFLDAKRTSQDGEFDVYNSAGLFSRTGALVRQYDKVHLLPFGEALPLSWKFRFLKRINFGQANFQPGRLCPPILLDGGSFGPLICFESIFPDLSRRYVDSGADFLVNITNDGWFGNSPGPRQHAQMCILRAVENRRALVRSANTGVSMVVDPLGRIVASLDADREGILMQKIPMPEGRSFYTERGDYPVLLGSILLVLVGVLWKSFRISNQRLFPSARKSGGSRRSLV